MEEGRPEAGNGLSGRWPPIVHADGELASLRKTIHPTEAFNNSGLEDWTTALFKCQSFWSGRPLANCSDWFTGVEA